MKVIHKKILKELALDWDNELRIRRYRSEQEGCLVDKQLNKLTATCFEVCKMQLNEVIDHGDFDRSWGLDANEVIYYDKTSHRKISRVMRLRYYLNYFLEWLIVKLTGTTSIRETWYAQRVDCLKENKKKRSMIKKITVSQGLLNEINNNSNKKGK